MGYSDIKAGNRKQETWTDAARRVFAFLFPRRREVISVPAVSAPVKQSAQSPYVQRGGDVVLAFRVGCRYYHSAKNRVFECIALKGKRARSVAFSCLDKVEEDKTVIVGVDRELYSWMWHNACIDGGSETCQRGALRADRQATEKEVDDELFFLSKLRDRQNS